MTFNNKQELIDKIKEKEDSAKKTYEGLCKWDCQTPEESQSKLLGKARNKAYMDAYADVIALIDSAKIVVYPEETGKMPCESAPKQEESKTLLEPLCYKCIKTEEECPFHRMGSAYGDCSGFKEQKVHEIRNDRFREFEFNYGIEKRTIDAKAIKSINIQKSFKSNTQYQVYVDSILMAEGEYEELIKIYNDLVAWWKYWKQA